MTILIEGKEKRIGLALSGGGFRAAAFHLGVMQKLKALGILDKIDVLSCVSGGSIAGGHLATNWGSPTVLDDLRSYLASKSIAVSSFLGGALNPFTTRLEALAKSYDRDLFNGKTLAVLKNGPRIYFNATNLSTGNMFSFVAGEKGAEEMGDYELGFVSASAFPISQAVAASSAFPPVFPPLQLDKNVYPHNGSVEYVTLSDGGLYDNMGIAPMLNKRTKVDFMIVSDGGKPFAVDDTPTESGAMVLKAGLDIMMEQIRGLEFDRIQHRGLAGVGPRPIWFSIDSTEGEAQAGDAAFASAIGTNLKALSSAELDVLTRHGGALVEARLRKYFPELI